MQVVTTSRRRTPGSSAAASSTAAANTPGSGGDHVLLHEFNSGGRARLSLYKLPPTQELTLTEFETYAMDRLIALRQLDTVRAKGLKYKEQQEAAEQMCHRMDLDDVYKDNVSHFILRLAFCKTNEQRTWFTNMETLLFRFRFEGAGRDETEHFFAASGMRYKPLSVDADEFDGDLRRQLEITAKSQGQMDMDSQYFKVPFEEALDLVGQRKVMLQSGFAYVPRRDLVSIVASKFRAHLSLQLAATYRASQNMRQDARIRPLVAHLAKCNVGPSYSTQHSVSGAVNTRDLPVLSERSFPLCMQNMYERLQKDSHLKYMGRMTFGLFLKGIGVTLQDSLDFWRRSFTKIAGDKFNKEYAYNIRHNYGKEGKRANYTPYSCAKIINASPGSSEYHGCPFRHWDEVALRGKLLQRRTTPKDVDDIVTLVKGHHYQLACQKYFVAHHDGHTGDGVGNHPNAFFDESAKHYNDKAAATADKQPQPQQPGGRPVEPSLPPHQ